MTTPSDPNRSGNENQSGLPYFPAAPATNDLPGAPVRPPTQITAAFWCYVVGAVVSLIGGVLVTGQKQTILNALRDTNSTLTNEQLDQLARVSIITAVVIAVIVAALYLLFAFKLRAGRNWARIVLTIIAVLALISLVVGRGGNPLSYVGDLAAIVGAVLSWLPQSSQYIAAVKRGNG